jgi:hypothetical protein
MKRLKVLNGYTAHHRFLQECGEETFWLARKHCPAKTPYSSGPSVAVVKWQDKMVWCGEVGQRRFEVWEIPKELIRAKEDEANQEQLASQL